MGVEDKYIFTEAEQRLINSVEKKLGVNYRDHDMHHKYIQQLIDADLVAYIQYRKQREERITDFFSGVWADVIRWAVRGTLALIFLSIAYGLADAWGIIVPGA